MVNSRLDIIESRGNNSGTVDDQERIKNLEILQNNMKAEINLIITERLNKQNKEITSRIAKLETVETRLEIIKKGTEMFQSRLSKNEKNTLENNELITNFQKEVRESLSKNSGKKVDLTKINELENSIAILNEKIKQIENQESYSQSQGVKNLEAEMKRKIENLEGLIQNVNKVSNQNQHGYNPIQNQDKFKELLIQNEKISYRVDTLRYDLDLIREDIVRERRNQKGYYDKLDNLTKKVESQSTRAGNESSRTSNQTNFMSAATYQNNKLNSLGNDTESLISNDHYLHNLKNNFGVEEYGQPLQRMTTGEKILSNHQRDIDSEDSFMKKFGSNPSGNAPQDLEFNCSLINQQEQSDIFEQNEIGNYIPENNQARGYSTTKPTISANKNQSPKMDIQNRLIQGGFNSLQTQTATSGEKNIANMIHGNNNGNKIDLGQMEIENNQVMADIQKRLQLYQVQAGMNKNEIKTENDVNNSLNTSFKIKGSIYNQSIKNSMIAIEGNDSLTLQIDDNNFLLDKDGYPILDDDGKPIKLTDDNLEFFKENNLYKEEIIG